MAENKPKKRWLCFYSLMEPDPQLSYINPLTKVVKLKANTDKEMLRSALKILKRSAKRVRRPKSWYVVNIFLQHSAGKKTINGREIFGLKSEYSNTQKILKLKGANVQEYFVRGYGPRTIEQLTII